MRRKFTKDAQELAKLIARHAVAGLVLGLPRNMDGTEGPAAQSARSFARNLAPLVDLPLAFWDERLSTAAVTRTLIEADRSRARRKLLVDKLAAAYILQGALDRLNRLAHENPECLIEAHRALRDACPIRKDEHHTGCCRSPNGADRHKARTQSGRTPPHRARRYRQEARRRADRRSRRTLARVDAPPRHSGVGWGRESLARDARRLRAAVLGAMGKVMICGGATRGGGGKGL